jgi:hypothetical protein
MDQVSELYSAAEEPEPERCLPPPVSEAGWLAPAEASGDDIVRAVAQEAAARRAQAAPPPSLLGRLWRAICRW